MPECLECKKIFVLRATHKAGKFCSLTCYHGYQKKYRYQPNKVCPNCGKTFILKYSIAKTQADRVRFCSRKCAVEAIPIWNKGLTKETDERVKLNGELIGKSRKGQDSWNKGKTGIFSQETLLKIGLGSKKWKRTPEYCKKISESNMGREVTAKTKRLIGDKNKIAMVRNWKDPQYVLMQIQKRGVKPNKTEQRYMDYFDLNFPDFKYNGDGRLGVVLAGLVPDFVNVNGKKQVVEIFGEYFHSEKNKQLKWHQTEIGRISRYKEVGFDCLVIWSLEIKKPELLKEKMTMFNKVGSN